MAGLPAARATNWCILAAQEAGQRLARALATPSAMVPATLAA